jgi:hypothetical protein
MRISNPGVIMARQPLDPTDQSDCADMLIQLFGMHKLLGTFSKKNAIRVIDICSTAAQSKATFP